MNFLLGCDPELFVTKGGALASAFGLIGGTKEEPLPVDKGAVQVDGMALEFNIAPASSKMEFSNNIQAVLEQLKQMVPEYELQPVPSVHFDKALLDSLPEEATQLGCDPDFNAYTGQANPTPDARTTLRTAAGHIHLGWTENQDPTGFHWDMCREVVREMDLYLGVPSVLLDLDNERRQLYGQAGAFRAKPYGVEYRVLSNFWLTKQELIDWVYEQVEEVISNLQQGKCMSPLYQDIIPSIINNGDREGAFSLIEEAGIKLPEGFVYEI